MKKLMILLYAISLCYPSLVLAQDVGMNITGSDKLTLETGVYLTIEGDLKISVTDGLIIPPESYVTTEGDLTLNARKAITVQTSIAPGAPRGSFIFNGSTVNHSNKGSIEVQSYIEGDAGTNYFMHFVGAPIEDTTSGWSKKVRLEQFNMTNLDTYAFEWHTDIDIDDQPWVNVWPFWHEVPVGNGLTLSNYEAGSDTIIMEGFPVAGTVNYTLTYNANNRYELISNPFPCAIDFDAFADDNGTDKMEPKYWIWDADLEVGKSAGNYVTRSYGTGGSQYIQYGQALFIYTGAASGGQDLNFTSDHKVHNSTEFRDFIPNELSMYVSGGTIGFKDALYIRFIEDASAGTDEYDAEKWNSVSEGATMIRSIADDGSELAINFLPIDLLSTTSTTVPVHFECGEEAQYTFSFEGFETFENNTEIWVEDLLTGADWIHISESDFVFSFLASPEQEKHRFNIHFFGPTSIGDPTIDNNNAHLKIYSSKEYAYVVNTSDEIIKEIAIYDIMGQQVLRKAVTGQNTLKFYVSDQTGYYVVRVLTDKKVHTEKILILK
ncbi:MAG: T9SS type A sorting domain-containing protein [Bacteroidetes bacterium]|nr:T9SS type A sorting domain-containing protein [Bacteroidota bacterium]